MTAPLEVDGKRPAVAWVIALPDDWLTRAERDVLLCIALDSYDGVSARPGWDNLGAWTHMHMRDVRNHVDRLAEPTQKRPALLRREGGGGRGHRVAFTLLKPRTDDAVSGDVPAGNLRADTAPLAEEDPEKPAGNLRRDTAPLDAKPAGNLRRDTAAPLFPKELPPPYARAHARGGAEPKLRGSSAAIWGETAVESVHRVAADRAPTGDGEPGNQDQKRLEEKLRREAASGPPCKHCPEPEYKHAARAARGEDTHDFEAAS